MKKILIIDDDVDISSLVADALEDEGLETLIKNDAFEAFRYIEGHASDVSLILLDVMMPGESGFEAFEKIKKLSGGAPVIYLTGKISEDDKVEGLMLGADDYIVKPFNPMELKIRIKKII